MKMISSAVYLCLLTLSALATSEHEYHSKFTPDANDQTTTTSCSESVSKTSSESTVFPSETVLAANDLPTLSFEEMNTTLDPEIIPLPCETNDSVNDLDDSMDLGDDLDNSVDLGDDVRDYDSEQALNFNPVYEADNGDESYSPVSTDMDPFYDNSEYDPNLFSGCVRNMVQGTIVLLALAVF